MEKIFNDNQHIGLLKHEETLKIVLNGPPLQIALIRARNKNLLMPITDSIVLYLPKQ